MLGLVEAAASYDPAKGLFSKWAWTFIKDEVLEAVRQYTFHGLSSEQFRYRPTVLAHRQSNPEATVEEIGRAMKATPTQVQRVLNYRQQKYLDAPATMEDDLTMGETLPADDCPIDKAVVDAIYGKEVHKAVHTALSRLPEEERRAVCGYFGIGTEPKSWRAISKEIGCSDEKVRLQGQRALGMLASDPAVSALIAR
jgi:RNA polymerase sigma factor (sigma-70 family)